MSRLASPLAGVPSLPVEIAWRDVAAMVGFLLSILLSVGWLVAVRPCVLLLAYRFRNWTYKLRSKPTSNNRAPDEPTAARNWAGCSYRTATSWISINLIAMFALVLAPPALAAHIWPGGSLFGAIGAFGVAFLGIGAVLLAVGVGAKRQEGCGKLGFFVVGLLHGLMQVTVPLAIMMYASFAGVSAVLVTWLAAIALTILMTRSVRVENPSMPPPKPPGLLRVLIVFVWIVQWAATLVLLARCAGGEVRMFEWSYGWIATPVGIICLIHLFGWYLLVTVVWGGHNNEAGAAIRCEDYKQWIRFHVEDNGTLTGYVIAIDTVGTGERNKDWANATTGPTARLLDVFRMVPPEPKA